MQTIYYAASHVVHHEDNLVDLDKFRRKLAQSQKQPTTSHTEDIDSADCQPPITICPAVSRTRPDHFNRIAWALDTFASVGVIMMTLSFAFMLFT